MLIAPANKVSKSFAEYLKCVSENKGPVLVTSDDDKPVAALVKLNGDDQLLRLFQVESTSLRRRRLQHRQENRNHRTGPTEEQVLSDPALLTFYQKQIKPRFEKFGRVYTTDTPDIRLAIPGRRKSSVFALIRRRKNHLKLFLRKGKKMAQHNLYPTADLPAEFDNWLEQARKYTDRM